MFRLLTFLAVASVSCVYCHAQNDSDFDWSDGWNSPHRIIVGNNTGTGIIALNVMTELEQHELQKAIDSAFESAKQNGLIGQWYVLRSEKDGKFSEAQIGQAPSDVISITAGQQPNTIAVG